MCVNPSAVLRGLSEPVFRARIGTEEPRPSVLFEMRRRRGFLCEHFSSEKYSRIKKRKHSQCKHQMRFTAGRILGSTRLLLVTWFSAIYELAQVKGGISSIELARRPDVRQPTA